MQTTEEKLSQAHTLPKQKKNNMKHHLLLHELNKWFLLTCSTRLIYKMNFTISWSSARCLSHHWFRFTRSLLHSPWVRSLTPHIVSHVTAYTDTKAPSVLCIEGNYCLLSLHHTHTHICNTYTEHSHLRHTNTHACAIYNTHRHLLLCFASSTLFCVMKFFGFSVMCSFFLRHLTFSICV